MAFELDNVVPWGRSYTEYTAMFNLTNDDLQGKILGCADGPAAFNKSLTAKGGSVISFDPLYGFSTVQIRKRIEKTFDEVLTQVRQHSGDFVWKKITSPEHLGMVRMTAMQDFLTDFATGLNEGRYVAGELPELPFTDNQFDLALCSHLLFLYSEQLSLAFHLESIKELCRAANEVRIFPLLELNNNVSRHLDVILDQLTKESYQAQIIPVDYEFQNGGDKMLSIKSK